MKKKLLLNLAILTAVTLTGGTSCVNVNTTLGEGFNQIEQLYDVYTAELPLDQIEMCYPDSLSAYSSRRLTVGCIRDEVFGLVDRTAAFSLIPSNDTLDFGTNARVRQFHISFDKDTTNYRDASQSAIIQNLQVYALEDAGISLDNTLVYTDDIDRSAFAGLSPVHEGALVYDGGDSLSFDLSKEYAQKIVDRMVAKGEDGLYIIEDLSDYKDLFPGLYITCDAPVGNGGRINMFDTALEYDEDTYYVYGDFAELKITADYGTRKDVDTSFIFLIGQEKIVEEIDSLDTPYVFNAIKHEKKIIEGVASDKLYVEGGCGVKPVVRSGLIRDLIFADFANNGISDPSEVIINKATIEMPFEMSGSYEALDLFPTKLSPTSRISGKYEDGLKYVTYVSLADASMSAENQGDINRSTLCYSPDISFHTQQIIGLKDPSDATLALYDIWFFITTQEVNKNYVSSSSSSDYSDYLSQMAYYSYLNSMYGGYGSYGYGYGYSGYGYGSYGGYGSNYYTMMAYYNMLYGSSSSSSEETVEEIDRDRYYNAELNGPASPKGPVLKITYSVSKTNEK